MAAKAAPPTGKLTPDFVASDYMKFFGAGALAACGTHGVCIRQLQDSFISG